MDCSGPFEKSFPSLYFKLQGPVSFGIMYSTVDGEDSLNPKGKSIHSTNPQIEVLGLRVP